MPVVHEVAELRARWGTNGARTILDACGTKVFLPGGSDPETLEMASRLSGQFAAPERGSEFDTRHPIMTEDMIRQLPVRRDGTGYAFILRNGLSPVIGRPPVIWRDRRARRMGRRAPQPAVATEATMDPAGSLGWDAMADALDGIPAPSGEREVDFPISGQVGDGASVARERRAWDQIGSSS